MINIKFEYVDNKVTFNLGFHISRSTSSINITRTNEIEIEKMKWFIKNWLTENYIVQYDWIDGNDTAITFNDITKVEIDFVNSDDLLKFKLFFSESFTFS